MNENARGTVRIEQGAKRVRAYLAGRLVADGERREALPGLTA
jgi:uncharacterized protein (DUF427 family)